MKYPLKRKLKNAADRILRPYVPDVYAWDQEDTLSQEVEDYFETSDGRLIPITKHHRYSLKKAWSMFGPMSALHELDEKGLLDEKDRRFFDHAKGYRTIESPLSEVRHVLAPYLEKHAGLFLSNDVPDLGQRVLKPQKQDVEQAIQDKAKSHKRLLEKINCLVPSFECRGTRILEIGYTSGGESIIGFERLGAEAYGIDYNYDGSFNTNSRHKLVAELAHSGATFLTGDITKKTSIDSEFLDVIYTVSVLEHIQDLPAAFAEMFRILKPGGLMWHRHDPYFHIKGGHPPCMLDSPWAHMRMDDQDVERYIWKHRPHEAQSTIPWIRSALNRKHTQGHVQKALIESGFEIHWWKNQEVAADHKKLLRPDIIVDCLAVNADVSLTDLLNEAVAFIAIKPE